jgi:hypothetical protein
MLAENVENLMTSLGIYDYEGNTHAHTHTHMLEKGMSGFSTLSEKFQGTQTHVLIPLSDKDSSLT